MLKWRKKGRALEEERIKGGPEGRWKGWGRAVGWGGVGGCGCNKDPAFPVADHRDAPEVLLSTGEDLVGVGTQAFREAVSPAVWRRVGGGPTGGRVPAPLPSGGPPCSWLPRVPQGDEAPVAPRVAVRMFHIQLLGASCLSSLPHWSLLPNKLPELSPLLRSTAGGFGTKNSISLCPWYEVPPPHLPTMIPVATTLPGAQHTAVAPPRRAMSQQGGDLCPLDPEAPALGIVGLCGLHRCPLLLVVGAGALLALKLEFFGLAGAASSNQEPASA